MKKVGFSLLTASEEESDTIDFLPKQYNTLNRYFELGDQTFDLPFIMLEDTEIKIPLESAVYQKAKIGLLINTIFSSKEIKSLIGMGSKVLNIPEIGNLFQIGICDFPAGSRILICVDSGNIYHLDDAKNYGFLENSLFEFIGSLKTIKNEYQFNNNQNYYKNWGEEFWRLRDNEKFN